MKVCVSSSCKFMNDWEQIKKEIASLGVEVFLPSDTSYEDSENETDSIEEKKSLMAEYNSFIDVSDILYVYCPNGYIGLGVSIEMGYAYAKGKKIVSSEEIKEMGGRALTNLTLGVSELKEYLIEVLDV